jgi:hypothetical protein
VRFVIGGAEGGGPDVFQRESHGVSF